MMIFAAFLPYEDEEEEEEDSGFSPVELEPGTESPPFEEFGCVSSAMAAAANMDPVLHLLEEIRKSLHGE